MGHAYGIIQRQNTVGVTDIVTPDFSPAKQKKPVRYKVVHAYGIVRQQSTVGVTDIVTTDFNPAI